MALELPLIAVRAERDRLVVDVEPQRPAWLVAEIGALPIRPGEEIIAAGTTRFRVLDVVVTEDDSDKYVGLLRVELP